MEHVRLISGEYAPLVLHDPVTKSVAQAGLVVMGGVAAGAAVPASMQWMGTGITAFRTAPWQVVGGATLRGGLDAAGQYGAGLLLQKGYKGAFNKINWIESGMAAGNLNPYFVAVGSAGLSWSRKDNLQSVFYDDASVHNISNAKFFTQAAVGLSIGHFGGKLEHRLAANQYRAWRTYTLATLMNAPRWGQPSVGAGLRWGQAYGTPLLLGVVEETNEGFFGDGADEWWKDPNGRSAPVPAHPDSPVFRENLPQP